MAGAAASGLDNVLAGKTAISDVGEGLSYRGYDIRELAAHCDYDEVAHLLLYGELPTVKQKQQFLARVNAARRLTQPLRDLLKALPRWVHPLDALRTSVSTLSHFDQDVTDNTPEANLRKAERMLAQLPVAIVDHYRYSQGLQAVPATQELGTAANFLYMLRGGQEASPEEVKDLDQAMLLYAEHEWNASTFVARVVTSTMSDLHSSVIAGIAALKGPWHGGANERVIDLLTEIAAPESAESWTADALNRKERIMGFGHRVCRVTDIRAELLEPRARAACVRSNFGYLNDIAAKVESVVVRERQLPPNIDWPAGRLLHALGIEKTLFTPIFAMARVAGWSAHVIEQTQDNRLIRPRAEYTGPAPRSVQPIADRV